MSYNLEINQTKSNPLIILSLNYSHMLYMITMCQWTLYEDTYALDWSKIKLWPYDYSELPQLELQVKFSNDIWICVGFSNSSIYQGKWFFKLVKRLFSSIFCHIFFC